MAFVDEHQRVGRQIVDERRRRLALLPPRKVARVILDAFAESHFDQHLKIEVRALFDTLTLNQPVLALEKLDALAQLFFDRLDRPHGSRAWCHVVARRIDSESRHALQDMPRQRVEH